MLEFLLKKIFLHKNHNIMLVQDLGNIIKTRRKELKITQPHLAELAGISTNTLYKLERGQGNPSLEVLNKLAEVLGLVLSMDIKKNA
jgi:y4mF family transcriptional regulator